MIAYGGAMSIGGRRGDEANARRDEGAHGALEQGRERREQWALSAEVKNSPPPSSRIYRSMGAMLPELHAPRALAAGDGVRH
jgi:hypothetical protein